MKVLVEFVTSAAAPHQFPAPGAPEAAFLGRSNVGKSSLLNSLTASRIAKVSNTPGRTQTINFFSLELGKPKSRPDLVFADLPGYGYARVPRAIVGEWPKFIVPYLEEREPLVLCICLVDASIPPQKSDIQLASWLREKGRPLQLVATKSDRLSGNKLKQSLAALTAAFGLTPLPYSSKNGAGKSELWRSILQASTAITL